MRIGATPGLKQLQQRIRRKRCRLFLERMQPTADMKILDIGGTAIFWMMPEMSKLKALLMNIYQVKVPEAVSDRLEAVVGDATELSYNDDEFDLVFSNSVIEHVFTFENQKKMAAEIRRVGKDYWVQTPAKGFFFEPHFMAPFIHWLPPSVRKRIVRWATPWGLFGRPNKQRVSDVVDEIRILTKREVEELFPDAEIYVERFLGMPKSYVAIRKSSSQ
jgi:hypothetical protein